jgi:tetratricopeptide (TPR) repeat protein
MQLAERAYKLNPESGEVLDTLGWLLVRQGDIAGGLPYLRRAAERHHDHPDIQFHLAYALSKHGDGPAARDLLKKILAENQAFASHKEAIALLGELQSLPAMR